MSEIRPYPLLLKPWLLEKVWGGEGLKVLDLEQAENMGLVGEAWLLSSLPEHQSLIQNGPLAGRTLGDALEVWEKNLMGSSRQFPLLLKLLEARENLSVQVHPSEEQEPGRGKEESWLVLKSEGGAVYRGLKSGVSGEAFGEALNVGSPEQLLERECVSPGDVLDIPAGTVHAILSGVLLFEAQQPSDVTYRLYDYGRDRPLHIDQGRRVLQEIPPPPKTRVNLKKKVDSGMAREQILTKSAYTLELIYAAREWELPGLPDRVQVLVNLDLGDEGIPVGWEGGNLTLAPGHALLLPAEGPSVVIGGEGRNFILACPGA